MEVIQGSFSKTSIQQFGVYYREDAGEIIVQIADIDKLATASFTKKPDTLRSNGRFNRDKDIRQVRVRSG